MAFWWEHADPPEDPRYYPAPVPSTGVFDSPLVYIALNEQWLGHLDGLIGRLLQRNAWLGSDTDVDFAVDQIQRLLAHLESAIMDEKLKVSAADTTAGYLEDKLLPGVHVTLPKSNPGANENLTVATDPALRTSSLDFTYLTPNPQLIATLPLGARLSEVELTIDTPFDGIFVARIGVPGDNEKFMGGADNHAYLQGLYSTNPNYVCPDVTDVYLYTVNSGVTEGAGRITLTVED